MLVNKLFINDSSVEFAGFELLNKRATICLYEGGIVIVPEWSTESLENHYEITLDTERKTHDKVVIDILKDRVISGKNRFICIDNSHYVTSAPLKSYQA